MPLSQFNQTFQFWALGFPKKMTDQQKAAKYITCFDFNLQTTLMGIHSSLDEGVIDGKGFLERFVLACSKGIRRWYGISQDDIAEEKFDHSNTYQKAEPFAQFEFRFKQALKEHEEARARSGRSGFTDRDRLDALEKRLTPPYLKAICAAGSDVKTLQNALDVCGKFESGVRKTQRHALLAASRADDPHAARIVVFNPYRNTRVAVHPSGAQSVVDPPSSYLGDIETEATPVTGSLAPARARDTPDYKVQTEGKFVTRGWADADALRNSLQEQQEKMRKEMQESFGRMLDDRLATQRRLL